MTSGFEHPRPTPLHQLSLLLETQPETFASGNREIQDAALQSTEHIFNLALNSESQAQPRISALLASFSPRQAPVTRSQSSANGKRKRSPSPPPASKDAFERTPLTCLYVQGLDKDQIWAQLELRGQNVCKMLEYALDGTDEPTECGITPLTDNLEKSSPGEDDSDLSSGESDDDSETDEETDGFSDEELSEEGVSGLRDHSVDKEEEGLVGESRPSSSSSPPGTKGGHLGLNDGFFDLEEFNAETEEAETRFVSNGALDADSDDIPSDEGDIDYFVSIDGQLHADDDHEPLYADFFAAQSSGGERKKSARRPGTSAPSKVRFHEEVKVKTIKARGKGLPLSTMQRLDDDDDDDDPEIESEDEGDDDQRGGTQGPDQQVNENSDAVFSSGHKRSQMNGDESPENGFILSDDHHTIKRLQDDILADEDEPDDGLSTHEKRLAALQQEIAALEAENVTKKDWTMIGEATSRIRPHNSLLEEDLEFERVMKAVPDITEEIVSSLEDRIKARILEARFDDVVRKRPVDDKPFLPSRFFDLQDTKSKQSLAQIYEDEYIATQMGGIAGEDRDGKLKAEHEEITRIWETISSKLDALSNAHFTPKAPTATISTVTNVASASLESALPTSNTVASMLAPGEIYERPSADPRARGELSPKEKRAARNKQKKAKKKARDALESSMDKFAKTKGSGGIKAQKSAALRSIVKSGKGVTVVGKQTKGERESKTRSSISSRRTTR
ncbi:U3 small nucleolar ribonucleoprotein complex, subunit Mpp10 [Russula compacta]|nr:U3 small nucleolar ribonucleoprotein complex, subunit Mpp10 [Russula compacta]